MRDYPPPVNSSEFLVARLLSLYVTCKFLKFELVETWRLFRYAIQYFFFYLSLMGFLAIGPSRLEPLLRI